MSRPEPNPILYYLLIIYLNWCRTFWTLNLFNRNNITIDIVMDSSQNDVYSIRVFSPIKRVVVIDQESIFGFIKE